MITHSSLSIFRNYESPRNNNRAVNFTIENEHCRIVYKTPVDLVGLDLDDIFNFSHTNAEVYRGNTPKPMNGYGLNKPATITYLNICVPEDDDEFEKLERKVIKLTNSRDAYFMNLDKESDSMTFKVIYF